MSGLIGTSTLVIEVTRKCNLHCEHCLRGDAQCVDMKKETIDKLIPMLDNVGQVVFTGGEPSLNTELIEYFFKQFHKLKGYTPAFYVVTNGIGREQQLRLCSILMDAYIDADDVDICGIAISKDEYHDLRNVCEIAKALAFYRDDKDMTNTTYDWVIQEGRAADNGLGTNQKKLHSEFYINNEEEFASGEETLDVELLYVSALEEVIGECDFSYADIDEQKLCMLDELPEYIQQLRTNLALVS